jgi:hypothetical protein
MNTPGTVMLAALALLVSGSAVAEIYKCIDARGATRYSDKPCAGSAVIITPETAPVISEEAAGRMDRTRRLLRAYEAEHEEERRAEAEQQAKLEQRKGNCARAQAYERGVTQASRVYRTDESGQRFDLTTEERAATEARARAEVARWCDSE